MNQTPYANDNELSMSNKGSSIPTLTKGSLENSQDIDIRISDIVKSIPIECFRKDSRKAWFFAIINVLLVGIGCYYIAISPWYFLPIPWIITGTGLAGFFTLGHDCGHYSFSETRWVNDVFGHLFLLPLIYPFYTWCLEHNCHHTRTNKLGRPGWRQIHDIQNGKADPNWQPLRVDVYSLLVPKNKSIYRLMRSYFWWTGTILNWWEQVNIDSSKISLKDQKKVNLSKFIVVVFSLTFFPTLIVTAGIWGFIKFWLVPWLIYHAWFSTFTLVHHTSPETKWKTERDWNAAQANLSGTIHCDYPWWVEFLCHDINYHVPHHISTAIPFYNLRTAHLSLRSNWGSHLNECKFSWSLISQIISQCHLYDSDNERYTSFNER